MLEEMKEAKPNINNRIIDITSSIANELPIEKSEDCFSRFRPSKTAKVEKAQEIELEVGQGEDKFRLYVNQFGGNEEMIITSCTHAIEIE